MAAETSVSVKIDTEAAASHLHLGRGQVGRTVQFDEVIYVDLDQFGVVVGIELLDLDTSVRLDELSARFDLYASARCSDEDDQWGAPRLNITAGSPSGGLRLQLAAHRKMLTDARTADSSMRTLWPLPTARPDPSERVGGSTLKVPNDGIRGGALIRTRTPSA